MEIYDSVNGLVEKYSDELAKRGIVCKAERKFFETTVHSKSSRDVFGIVEKIYLEKKENKRYKGQNNRFVGVLIKFYPAKVGIVKLGDCREYFYTVRKIHRHYRGDEPIEKVYKGEKILAMVEKRILKVLRDADARGIEFALKDQIFDVNRYMSFGGYEGPYKRKMLGRDVDYWSNVELVFGIALGVGLILLMVVLHLIFG